MKFISLFLCIATLLCFVGCSARPAIPSTTQSTFPSSPPTPTDVLPSDTEDELTAVYEAPMAAISLPVLQEQRKAKDSDVTIASYIRQDVTVTLPDADVAQTVELDILNRIDKTQAAADLVFTAAEKDYSGQASWYPYAYSITYAPMRMDKNVLSLFGAESTFDGSPRSMTKPVSLNYDLTTGTPLTLRTILHEENFADTLCDLILEGLSSQKDSLFDDYETIIRGSFSTNVPVDSWYFSDEGICFYFAPYEIAPYATGTIISQIPYDKVSGLLNDAYFPAEKTSYSGVILAQTVTDTKVLENFTQFAEVALEEAGEKLLIYADGSVSNVRLHYTGEDGSQIVILGVAGMGPKDAVLAELSLDWAMENLMITFDSYGQTQTLSLIKNDDGMPAFVK